MIPAWLAFFDGLLSIALVVVGIVGAYLHLIAPFMGFQLFLLGFLLSIVGFIFGVIGLFRTGAPSRRVARPRALLGFVVGIVIAVPVIVIIASTRKYPPINDITTDFNNSPEFARTPPALAADSGSLTYNKARFSARQQAGYGTIAPLALSQSPDAAFARVRTVAGEMPDWKITYTDPAARVLQGTATSALFHFVDDFVIQVRPAPTGGGSLVEMRSRSRVGVGDFGANAKRIRAFFKAVSHAVGTPS